MAQPALPYIHPAIRESLNIPKDETGAMGWVQSVGAALAQIIHSAEQSRHQFTNMAREIDEFLVKPDYTQYQENGGIFKDLSPHFSLGARSSIAQQYVDIMGAHVAHGMPRRRVATTVGSSPEASVRNKVLEQYLEMTAKTYGYPALQKRVFREASVYGVGVAWAGYNRRTRQTELVSDRAVNLLLDPDATLPSQERLVGRKRLLDKGWWRQRMSEMPDANGEPLSEDGMKAIDEILQHMPEKPAASQSASSEGDAPTDEWSWNSNGAMRLVETYDLWLTVSIDHYRRPNRNDSERFDQTRVPEIPLHYICDKQGTVLSIEPWSPDLTGIGKWPCALWRPGHYDGNAWAPPLLAPGLGWMRAIAVVNTIMVARFLRVDSKTILAMGGAPDMDEMLGKVMSNVEKFMEVVPIGNGSDLDGRRVSDLLTQVNMGTQEFHAAARSALEYFERRFADETGLNELLRSGTTGTQLRSAAAASLVESANSARIQMISQSFGDFLADANEIEASYAVTMVDPADIKTKLGANAEAVWTRAVSEEAKNPAYWSERMLAGVGRSDPNNLQLIQRAEAEAIQEAQRARSLQDIVGTSDFKIEVSDLERKDPQHRRSYLETMTNHAVPAMLGSAAPSAQRAAYEIMAAAAEENGMSGDLVNYMRRAGVESAEFAERAMAAQQQEQMPGEEANPVQ